MIKILYTKIAWLLLLFAASMSFSFAQELSSKDTATVQFINSRKFYIYKVDKGETLFSISQKFKIPQEEILEFNKEVRSEGLKAKMKLWVPAYSWLKKDSIAAATPPEIKTEKSLYKIAIVTTLNLPRIYTEIDTSESYVPELLPKKIRENLEFMEGAMRAAEKDKSKSKIQVHLIDSEGDTATLSRRLRKYTFDQIITNESGRNLRWLNQYSESANIPLITCGINTAEQVRNNKSAISLMPSSNQQCKLAGRFAGRYYPQARAFTIGTGNPREQERNEMFEKGWKNNNYNSIRQLDFLSSIDTTIIDNLDSTVNNVLFIPSSDEDLVSSILNLFVLRTPACHISVIGLPTWQYFETLDERLLQACGVHLFSTGFIDFNSTDVAAFRKFFRERYYSEPLEDAYIGFDAMQIGKMNLGPTVLDSSVVTSSYSGLYTNYHFVRESVDEALINEVIHVFQPSKDISIDLAKTPEN